MDTKNWKEFKITDLFQVRGSKKSFTKHQIFPGAYSYITTSNKNNGVSGTSSIWTEKGNVITFDSATNGKCFYQENNFIATDHVEILEPINFKLNKFLGLFFITILNHENFKYSYGRGRTQKRMKKSKIYLPAIIENEKQKPDFKFMENYIKNISKKINYKQNLEIKKMNSFIDTKNWQEFKITDIFDITKGERLVKTVRIKGEIPLITASSKKNGVVDFIDFQTYKDKKKLFSNVITIDMFFNVFYQQEIFFADDNIHCLKIKNNIELNNYIALFLISCLRKIKKKYDFGRQVRLKRLEKQNIKIPINKENKPDFTFMETFIKSLPYSKYI